MDVRHAAVWNGQWPEILKFTLKITTAAGEGKRQGALPTVKFIFGAGPGPSLQMVPLSHLRSLLSGEGQ